MSTNTRRSLQINSGSRGIGHQACTDFVRRIDRLMPGLGIDVPDRQLACVPMEHDAAQDYFGAMDAAGNDTTQQHGRTLGR